MSEPKPPPPPPSNSSRIVVIVAVAVLIVVAVAGIVLAGRRAPAEPSGVAAVAPAPAATGSTPEAGATPTDAVPSELVFAPASDKLPPQSSDGLARFADAARASASSVRLSARFLTGEFKARDMELAKARTGAIRHALEADGITSGKMQIELIEMPAGSLTDAASNKVDLTLR